MCNRNRERGDVNGVCVLSNKGNVRGILTGDWLSVYLKSSFLIGCTIITQLTFASQSDEAVGEGDGLVTWGFMFQLSCGGLHHLHTINPPPKAFPHYLAALLYKYIIHRAMQPEDVSKMDGEERSRLPHRQGHAQRICRQTGSGWNVHQEGEVDQGEVVAQP